jgi:hypothetical protein
MHRRAAKAEGQHHFHFNGCQALPPKTLPRRQ